MAAAKQKSKAKASRKKAGTTDVSKDPQTRTKQHGDMIAEAAYYKAENRGFLPGYEQQDWLEAEREIDESIIQH